MMFFFVFCIGIVIQYDMNSFEFRFSANVVKINHATAMRDEREYRIAELNLCKGNLEDKWFYCCRKSMNVLVVLVEANIDTLFIKEKLFRCNIAWAIRKYTKRMRALLLLCLAYYFFPSSLNKGKQI